MEVISLLFFLFQIKYYRSSRYNPEFFVWSARSYVPILLTNFVNLIGPPKWDSRTCLEDLNLFVYSWFFVFLFCQEKMSQRIVETGLHLFFWQISMCVVYGNVYWKIRTVVILLFFCIFIFFTSSSYIYIFHSF